MRYGGFRQRHTCEVADKVSYPDEISAKRDMVHFQDQFRGSGHKAPKRAYFCEHCGGWHLTAMEEVPPQL